MNIRFLIDAITQQTTVLIAQLATIGGIRAPLAHIADQVFLELSNELDDLGVTRKVAADMFGMALRSYHAKIRRLSESATEPARRLLWEAVYDFVKTRGPVPQQDVLRRFRHDDDAHVRGILFDLVQNGVVYQTGAREERTYRAVPTEEFEELLASDDEERLYWGVWMFVYRAGPISRDELERQLSLEPDTVDGVVERLMADGHLREVELDGQVHLESEECMIPMDEPAGWEAAVFDHFSAMATAMTNKLRQIRLQTLPADEVGGSTYTFDVWDGHPMRAEARSLLRKVRAQASEFNERLRQHNESVEMPDRVEEVVFYVGQAVITDESDEPDGGSGS